MKEYVVYRDDKKLFWGDGWGSLEDAIKFDDEHKGRMEKYLLQGRFVELGKAKALPVNKNATIGDLRDGDLYSKAESHLRPCTRIQRLMESTGEPENGPEMSAEERLDIISRFRSWGVGYDPESELATWFIDNKMRFGDKEKLKYGSYDKYAAAVKKVLNSVRHA